jgi:hypothetical protein
MIRVLPKNNNYPKQSRSLKAEGDQGLITYVVALRNCQVIYLLQNKQMHTLKSVLLHC